MVCLVRSLRWRRPSILTDLAGVSTIASAGRRRRRQQAVDDTNPCRAGLFERQAIELAHAPPAFVVGDRLEGEQRLALVAGGQSRKLGPEHELHAHGDELADKLDAL